MKTPSRQEIQDSYDRLHESGHFESQHVGPFILRNIDPAPGLRVLDVGCGTGDLLSVFATAGMQLFGLDISPVAVEKARTALAEANLEVGVAESLPWDDDYFDRVTCIGTVEHLIDPEQGVQEIARVLKPGGLAYIYVPNSYYWRDILRAILKGSAPHHGQLLERFAARQEWTDLLERNGLSVEGVQTWYASIRTALTGPKAFIGALIDRIAPTNLSHSFGFRCRPAARR